MERASRRRNAPVAVAARRVRERTHDAVTAIVHPLTTTLARRLLGGQRIPVLRRMPRLPRPLRRYADIPVWSSRRPPVPDELRTVAGILRDPERERAAYAQRRLHDFQLTHREAFEYFLSHGWDFLVPALPRLLRGYDRMVAVEQANPTLSVPPVPPSPAELSAAVRDEAARLGLSAVGFTRYDEHYTFAEFGHDEAEVNVIVCVVEQDFAATQTIPSSRGERAAFQAYNELLPRVNALAEFVQGLGFRCRPQNQQAESVLLHYGVAAGLGQLGLNGQLLTPQAGSRCRLAMITTSAPVELDAPVDHGVEKVCDACQLCVRRCPSGAIPLARREHRGVTKVKIKPERCFPVMVQTHGCAVCMKVCPVQRYGLDAVQAHLVATGEVLGKGTDELEGYVWPPDGRFYGAGEKPPMSRAFLNPPGWLFDPQRREPIGGDADVTATREH
jgi:epoxyqueuosine reductase